MKRSKNPLITCIMVMRSNHWKKVNYLGLLLEDAKFSAFNIHICFSEDVASKKPIRIEDQEVRDEHGRRRFHGAFTGGFSAGYYNTVDTKEGWRPSEFKSSRSDRNKKDERKPEDYMDQEDLGSFGIAPQMLRAKDEFGDNQIGRRQTKPLFASKGPIPGK